MLPTEAGTPCDPLMSTGGVIRSGLHPAQHAGKTAGKYRHGLQPSLATRHRIAGTRDACPVFSLNFCPRRCLYSPTLCSSRPDRERPFPGSPPCDPVRAEAVAEVFIRSLGIGFFIPVLVRSEELGQGNR